MSRTDLPLNTGTICCHGPYSVFRVFACSTEKGWMRLQVGVRKVRKKKIGGVERFGNWSWEPVEEEEREEGGEELKTIEFTK